jgi:DNA primase
MQDNVKDRIKSEITAREYISFYIGDAIGSKWTCPFHAVDKTPSLSAKGSYYNCFGCGESGDIFEFVGKLYNLEFAEASKKIMRDFGYSNTKPTWQDRLRQVERKEMQKEERERIKQEKKIYSDNANLYRILRKREQTPDLIEYIKNLELWLDENLV